MGLRRSRSTWIPLPAVPGHRAAKERRAGPLVLAGQDFRVGQAGVIVDRRVAVPPGQIVASASSGRVTSRTPVRSQRRRRSANEHRRTPGSPPSSRPSRSTAERVPAPPRSTRTPPRRRSPRAPTGNDVVRWRRTSTGITSGRLRRQWCFSTPLTIAATTSAVATAHTCPTAAPAASHGNPTVPAAV